MGCGVFLVGSSGDDGYAIVATTGNITQTGVLNVSSTASFTTSADNADITLNSANAITGAVTFVSTDTNTDNTEVVQYTGVGGVVLGGSTATGTLAIVATTGNITQTGVLNVSSTASFTTSANDATMRSEERRVGQACRSRWSPYH